MDEVFYSEDDMSYNIEDGEIIDHNQNGHEDDDDDDDDNTSTTASTVIASSEPLAVTEDQNATPTDEDNQQYTLESEMHSDTDDELANIICHTDQL